MKLPLAPVHPDVFKLTHHTLWTQFACAALSGLNAWSPANPEGRSMSEEDAVINSARQADLMIKEYTNRFVGE